MNVGDVEVREVEPLAAPPDTTIHVPGSRSITNRALVCAALADGTSTLTGVLDSDDTQAMLDCLTELGIRWHHVADAVQIEGCAGRIPAAPPEGRHLHTRLSGTTSRFVTALCALGDGEYTIDADGPMRRRPMGDLVDALRRLGVELGDADGHLPVTVHADGVPGREVEIAGDVSSQFLSALMLIAPCTPSGLAIHITGELKSVPYVEMTRQVMERFGATVAGAGGYRSATYAIEPDASTACYFWAAAAITGGTVRIDGLGTASMQGDVAFVDVLERMGCVVDRGTDSTVVTGPERLVAVDADLSDISDQGPTFAVVAAFAEGTSTASGVGFIRRKESDRIAAVVEGLRNLGVAASEQPDGFSVEGGVPHGGRIRTFDDHRIAMSFALAGLKTPGVVIEDPGCVAKTFPKFFDALDGLRGPA